jgi:uncharacterized iron-regulated membrane protein
MSGARAVRIWAGVHTWTSLISMLFLLMLCLTGLPLIFHDEIDDLFEHEITASELPNAIRAATLDQILQAAKNARPQDHVLFVGFREASPDVVVIGMSATPIPLPGRFHRMIFDRRTADLLGEEPEQQGVMDLVLTLHRDMFTGLPGELFLGAMGVLLVLSIVSGVVIYAPFTRRIDFGTIRHRSRRRTWLDVHNLIGIVTVVWLGVVAVTGTMNTLTVPLFDLWRAQTLPDLLKPYQGSPVAAPSSLDDAVARVRERLPGTTITSITLPTAARFGSPQHLVVWTKGASPLTARLFTPILVDVVDRSVPLIVGDLPWYLRFLQVSRPLHFGDYGGWPLKIIWALLDIMSIIVLVSGLYLWWARLRRMPAAPGEVGKPASGATIDVRAT